MHTRTDGVVNFQQKTMESAKDKHCYPQEHCSPYGIFNSIRKCYRCNESDVESFIFKQEGLPLNNGEEHNHSTTNACAGALKGERPWDDLLYKGNFEESLNINQANRKSASTLVKREEEGTSKNDTELLAIKNGISNYADVARRTSHILQADVPSCGSVVYTSKETPTGRIYIPRVGH